MSYNLPNHSVIRQQAITLAKKICTARPVYLDTETTGLGNADEIIEITIIDDDGQPLVNTLVKPTQPIPASATRVHGIVYEDVQTAPTWKDIWPDVAKKLNGRIVVFYNEEFDVRMMRQSHARYQLNWEKSFIPFDLLRLYAEFRGDWDPFRKSFRYHSLANAGAQCKISLPNAHRAMADTLLTRALLHFVADCA